MKKLYYYTFILFILMSLQSCYKDVGPIEGETDVPAEGISYSQDVQPIYDQNCISCHPNSGDLDLTAGNSYAQTVNANASGYSGKLVVPGDPENSILYKKIDGSGAYGSNMPLGSSLSQTQINTIKQWIEEGAENN